MNLTITSEINTSTAHYLADYDGKCSNIHGHTYRWVAELQLAGSDQGYVIGSGQERGMVMDFGFAKQLLNNTIDGFYDHALILEDNTEGRAVGKALLSVMHTKINFVPNRPTAEFMAMHGASLLRKAIDWKNQDNEYNGIDVSYELVSLKCYETPTNFAEWRK